MKREYNLRIIYGGKTLAVSAREGVLIGDILRKIRIFSDMPCGGNARCGKCRVKFLEGAPEPEAADLEFISQKELSEGFRLLCRAVVSGDCTVEPLRSPDETKMSIALSVSGTVPKGVCTGSAIAVDIGTTTIAAALLGIYKDEEGDELHVTKSIGTANSQRRWGADVITRIEAAHDAGVRSDLESCLRKDVEALVKELVTASGKDRVSAVVVTGNTTMLHFFTGKDTKGLGSFPYTPVSTQGEEMDPLEYFREKLCDRLIVMPGISAFVGADIISGLYSLDIYGGDAKALLADLGTNGEIAFWDTGRLKVTSTAAGPVFEAGNISCGCASVPGAIAHVSIDEKGRTCTQTIGDETPAGICGTGVLETVSELLRTGFVDGTGLLSDEYFEDGFPVDDTHRIVFSQQDIRQVQLAKAAILSGIKALTGKDMPDIVYISGGFGSSVDAKKIKNIRMFPDGFDDKICLSGNTALAGAIKFAGAVLGGSDEETAAAKVLSEIRDSAEVVELAAQDTFDGEYIEAINFLSEETGGTEMIDERWVFHSDAKAEDLGNGVVRRVLAYSKDLMCVENTFEKDAVGALHHHPHTQITYVVSGEFEFEIDGVKKIVRAGDTMLKQNSVEHGCRCLEAGILLDIFNPMREDFV